MRYEKLSRLAGLLAAALVATLTCAVAAHALQSATTANAMTVHYSLGAGANSGAITPIANDPVFVMGCQVETGNVGSSDMTVVNSAGFDNELVWSGLKSNGGGVTKGFSTAFGTHIMFIDYTHVVQLEVNNPTSFIVHNGAGSTQVGNVTLFW